MFALVLILGVGVTRSNAPAPQHVADAAAGLTLPDLVAGAEDHVAHPKRRRAAAVLRSVHPGLRLRHGSQMLRAVELPGVF